MIRRIFMMVVVAITFTVITVLIIRYSPTPWEASKGLLDGILAALEIVAVISILIVLHDYLSSRRPRRLLFEGVSNQGQLASAENAPTDLNTLAKEERIHQFLIIYYELRYFIEEAERQRRIESDRSQEGPADRTIHLSPFLSDELNFEDFPDTQKLARFFPSLHSGKP